MAEENPSKVKWHDAIRRTLLELTISISDGSLSNMTTDKWRLLVMNFNAATYVLQTRNDLWNVQVVCYLGAFEK